jgi:hypothetical protein
VVFRSGLSGHPQNVVGALFAWLAAALALTVIAVIVFPFLAREFTSA